MAAIVTSSKSTSILNFHDGGPIPSPELSPLRPSCPAGSNKNTPGAICSNAQHSTVPLAVYREINQIIHQNQDACRWISLPCDSLNLVAAGSYGPRPGGEGIAEEDGAGGDLNSNGEDRER